MPRKTPAQILNANKDKQFVQRILNPRIFPVMDNKNDSVSTHLMAAEVDDETGNWHVFPTIVSGAGGVLEKKELRKAQADAKKTGEFIDFGKDGTGALSFAGGGYKKAVAPPSGMFEALLGKK